MQVILLTAMEYLREDVVEKEEEIETASCKIRTIEVEESSGKTETSSQDAEEGWSEQEGKVSWVDRIKTIGK